jgi:hypothetical protein
VTPGDAKQRRPDAARPLDAESELRARIRDLTRENSRLRRIVADKALEIEMLRELTRGTY